ncbi:MAG: hypothetical protein HY692_01755 [Cyanobacteria bacterium NC_groundwater_1444_Ag_S-0.65um_54_12]|nr:hypothetical protein [Cyanobacteria bacterium NC_groundwater_1444_Ag_S-0.65um_54_12]
MEELLSLDIREQTVKIQQNRIAAVRHRDSQQLVARCFAGGQVQTAVAIGKVAADSLIQQAKEASATALSCSYALPPVASYQKNLVRERGLERFVPYVKQALDFLQERVPDFIFSGSLRSSLIKRRLWNSAGLDLEVEYGTNDWILLFKHGGSATIFDGGFEYSEDEGVSILETCAAYLPLLDTWNSPADLPGNRVPVAFITPEVLLDKLGQSLRIDCYSNGSALFSGRSGEALFSQDFGLADVNFDPARGIVAPFDGEGVLHESPFLPLIDQGIIKNLIADLRNGTKYGVPSTGNGQRTIGKGVSLDFNALVIRHGSRPYRELLGQLPACIVATLLMGGDTTDDGYFSCPVQLAFLSRHGEIVGRLPSFTVGGTLQEIFGSRLLGISCDGFGAGARNPVVFAELSIDR